MCNCREDESGVLLKVHERCYCLVVAENVTYALDQCRVMPEKTAFPMKWLEFNQFMKVRMRSEKILILKSNIE